MLIYSEVSNSKMSVSLKGPGVTMEMCIGWILFYLRYITSWYGLAHLLDYPLSACGGWALYGIFLGEGGHAVLTSQKV